jgi:hypothetical protein
MVELLEDPRSKEAAAMGEAIGELYGPLHDWGER